MKINILIKNILITAFIVVFGVFCLHCQPRYTLENCINSALSNNYDLLFTEFQNDYNAVLIKNAFGAYLPNVSADASYGRIIGNTEHLLSLNSYSLMLNANLLLYNGGSREDNYKLAKNQAKFTELQTKYLTEQLKLNVYSQFINIIRLQEIMLARSEDIIVSQSQLQNLQARYDAGYIPIDMLLSQEAELGNKEIQLLSAQIDFNTSKQILLTTMGIDPTSNAEFEDKSISANINENEINEFRNSIGNLHNSIELALNNRLDYSAQIVSRENTEYSKSASTGSYYPKLSAFANYGYSGSQLDNIGDELRGQVGLSLVVPIFSNYSTDLQVQQSELNYQRENTTLLKLEQSIKAEVQTAYFNLEATEKSLQIADKTLIAAERNFATIKGKMDAGSATMTDYITANNQYITAQTNKITSAYVYLNSKKNLLWAIGRY